MTAGPGEISALLEELARAPERELREAWERGLQPGAVVGRFELLREIGRGGFGVVYEARDRELGRLVAFKAIRPGNRSLAELRQRWLQREAEAAAQLNHRNIVTLHDFGRAESGPYLILELLHGETLEARLARGPLPAGEALAVSRAIAGALVHAHGAGVLHRDLKPSNVFLCEDGTVKVLDFGLAQILGTSGLRGGGTPAYMAPEQWRGGPEDARSDLFSLGAVLFAAAAGRAPFRVVEGRSSALEDGPAPRLEGAPAPLAALAARLLAKDPAGRPGSALEVVEAIDAAQRALAPPPRRRRLALALAAAVAALLAAGAALRALRQDAGGAPGERLVLSVADFVNETGERDLDGLSGMLITSLEQSRRLDVLTRSRVLDLARQLGRGEVARVDEALGRAVAREARAHALLLGTVRRFDEVYALEVQALDPERDAYLFTVSEQGSGKGSIPAIIDRLSERTRRSLRENADEIAASRLKVADAVTGSLDAYRHYFLGQQCIDGFSHLPDCAAEFRKAIAIDPSFALAHWMLAYTGEFRGAPVAEQHAAIAAALKLVDRVPWKEGVLIRAWAAHLDGGDDDALRLYRQVTGAFPEDKQAHYLAGDLLFHGGRMAEALPHLERALALDPGWQVLRAHVVEALSALERSDEAARRARAWAEQERSADAWKVLAIAEEHDGHLDAALAAIRRAVDAGGGDDARGALAELLLKARRLSEAEAELLALSERGSPAMRPYAFLGLAQLRALQGRRREGRAFLDRARAAEERTPVKAPLLRAAWLAGDGDAAAVAREIAAALDVAPREAAKHAALAAYVGDLALADRLAGGLAPGSLPEQLYRLVSGWRRQGARAALDGLSPPRAGVASFIAGEIALDAGDAPRAVELLERAEGPGHTSGEAWRGWAVPKGLYLLALAHGRAGEPERGLARLDELLALWKRADPDLRLLAEARALRAKLAEEARRAALTRPR